MSSSPLSLSSLLSSLKSVFPYIATVAETRFSTTAAIVATGAIIWKPGFISRRNSAQNNRSRGNLEIRDLSKYTRRVRARGHATLVFSTLSCFC